MSFYYRMNERCRERFRGAAGLLALAIVLAALPGGTQGQQLSVIEQEQQFEDLEAISVLEDTEWLRPPVDPGINADWGGWVTTSFYRFDDFDHYDRIDDVIEGANTVDFRFWTKVFVGERNSVYFRLKHRVNMTNWGSGVTGRGSTDHDGPHIDMFYASLKFPRSTVTRFGRQYFRLGRGLVLGNVLDGINVQKRFKKTALGLILAKTRPHDNNIDTSVPGWDLGSDRFFAGLTGELRMTSGRRFYTYLLMEDDRSEEIPDNTAQRYDYDATYLAFGGDGHIVNSLTYWGEVVQQWGRSPVSGSNTRAKVDAFAYNFGAAWLPDALMHPTFSLELFSASGDATRQHVTNTAGGRTSTSTDIGFYHFSTPRLGLAFSPRLSNIRILKFAFSFKPFIHKRVSRDLLISVVGSHFNKRKAQGALSDLWASENSKDVGNELDMYLFWKVLSDFRMSLRIGRFTPGTAFPATRRDRTLYTSLGVSYSY